MTELPTTQGRGLRSYHAALIHPLGTATAHCAVSPTRSRKALSLIAGIFKRRGNHGTTNFPVNTVPEEIVEDTVFIEKES